MNTVEPIRDRSKIKDIKSILKWRGEIRNLVLFDLGINSALRVSDLLSLTLGDVFDDRMRIVSRFEIREQKTGKTREVEIVPNARESLALYKEEYHQFFQEKSFNPRRPLFCGHAGKPLSRQMAWKLIRKWCFAVGLEGRYGTHTLRKTFGYHAWATCNPPIPIEIIREIFNHSDNSTTRLYLGITQEDKRNATIRLNL